MLGSFKTRFFRVKMKNKAESLKEKLALKLGLYTPNQVTGMMMKNLKNFLKEEERLQTELDKTKAELEEYKKRYDIFPEGDGE